jgi:hypothetical protein
MDNMDFYIIYKSFGCIQRVKTNFGHWNTTSTDRTLGYKGLELNTDKFKVFESSGM